MATC
jgi:hypothetical protein